jgi:hypothetical protein
LQHATQAILRKPIVTLDADAQNNPLDTHYMLDSNENQDLDATSFNFDFNGKWSEVRASSSHPTTFSSDPFQDSNQLLKVTLQLGAALGCDPNGPDSPAFDVQGLRDSDSKGRERYFMNHGGKDGWPAPAPESADCADFAQALDQIKALQVEGKTPPEINAALAAMPSSTPNESLLDKLIAAKDVLGFAKNLAGIAFSDVKMFGNFSVLTNAFRAADLVGLIAGDAAIDSWVTTIITDLPFDVIAPIGIPFYLWSHVIGDMSDAFAADKPIGELAAFRWWFYQLNELAAAGPLPSDVSIDLGSDQDAAMHAYTEVYLRDHYGPRYAGWAPTTATSFVLSPKDLKDGYLEGVAIIDRTGSQILKKVDQYISEAIDKLPIDPCKLKHLRDGGFIDFPALRAVVVRKFTWAILEKIPALPVKM